MADGFGPTAIVPGMVLADRYRIEQLLGRGQIADVYRGLDQLLARSIAVKVFRQGVVDAAAVARQRTEMQILANLHHPSLVAVYDAKFGADTIPVPGAAGQGNGTSAGLTYLVDELEGYPMCGVLSGAARFTDRLTLAYREAAATSDSMLYSAALRQSDLDWLQFVDTTFNVAMFGHLNDIFDPAVDEFFGLKPPMRPFGLPKF